MKTTERMDVINEKSLFIVSCAQSLKFILKDLDEMEMTANQATDGLYSGLTNIVEQLAIRIENMSSEIMRLSDSTYKEEE